MIPVADADRSKAFYERLGWRLDADFAFDNGLRVVQFTPPGSGARFSSARRLTSAAPGSAQGLYLIVSDVQAARMTARRAWSRDQRRVPPRRARRSVSARRTPIGSAGSRRARDLRLVRDLQRPGRQRVAAAGGHGPASGSHRPARRRRSRRPPIWRTRCGARRLRTVSTKNAKGGEYDVNWPDWYAAYMVAEQAGTELPT